MRRIPVRTFSRLAYAPIIFIALLAMAVANDARAELKPGMTVTRVNREVAQDYVSPGVYWAIEYGMDVKIVENKPIILPKLYQEATEKYAGQATVGDDNDLKNWVAGRPFPVIDETDPKAALKIMWNFSRTHYYSDDLNVHLPDADTGALRIDPENKRHYDIERHFIVDWARRLRIVGRVHNEPLPAFEENPDKTFEKAAFFPLIEPFDLKGVGTVSYRYLDPAKFDDTWLYTPVIRRVRRLSSAQRSDALFGQDIDLDSFGGYAGQVPWFDWKYIGKKPMLAVFHGENLPPVVCEGDGGMTYCENWEIRPEMFIVEGTPKLKGYAFSKRVIYVDKEAYLIPYSDLYDNNGELWKLVLNYIRTSTKPNPNTELTYDEEHQFVYGFSVFDTQLMHGTRSAIPGMAFPDEPGWYVDIGMDHEYSVDQDWYTVAALIQKGR